MVQNHTYPGRQLDQSSKSSSLLSSYIRLSKLVSLSSQFLIFTRRTIIPNIWNEIKEYICNDVRVTKMPDVCDFLPYSVIVQLHLGPFSTNPG